MPVPYFLVEFRQIPLCGFPINNILRCLGTSYFSAPKGKDPARGKPSALDILFSEGPGE